MASVASATTPGPVGLIDPTKQAEYPILLGDKLLGKGSAKKDRFVSLKYNHKAKAAPHLQKSIITPSGTSQDAFKLTIQDKSSNVNADNAAFTYRGSVDPASLLSDGELDHVVLVFDPKRKAFILEPVSTQFHFNLRTAPGKTNKQVAEQYPQLDTLPEDDHASSEDELGVPDDDNPYDFRHFLPKSKPEAANLAKAASTNTTPNARNVPNKATSSTTAQAKPKPKTKPPPKPKTQSSPPREQKRPPKTTASNNSSTAKPKPAKPASPVAAEVAAEEASASEAGEEKNDSQDNPVDPAASPNIIVDGDLIIDMGSPPPSRPTFPINPKHFSSNNTSANEADDDDDDDDDGDIDELDPPLPPGSLRNDAEDYNTGDTVEEGDHDELAAEMEAAFEEEARNQQMQESQQQPQYHESSDESEVSEEE